MYSKGPANPMSHALASRRGKGLYHHLIKPGDHDEKLDPTGSKDTDLAPAPEAAHSPGAGGDEQHKGEDYDFVPKGSNMPEKHRFTDPKAMNEPMQNHPNAQNLDSDMDHHSQELSTQPGHFIGKRGDNEAVYMNHPAPRPMKATGHVPPGTMAKSENEDFRHNHPPKEDMKDMDDDMTDGMSDYDKERLTSKKPSSLGEYARKAALHRKSKGKY